MALGISAYLGGSLLIFAGGYAWSRRVSGLTPMASIFQSMGMSCSNSGYVGYPILLVAMPAIASTALALNMIVENLIMIRWRWSWPSTPKASRAWTGPWWGRSPAG